MRERRYLESMQFFDNYKESPIPQMLSRFLAVQELYHPLLLHSLLLRKHTSGFLKR